MEEDHALLQGLAFPILQNHAACQVYQVLSQEQGRPPLLHNLAMFWLCRVLLEQDAHLLDENFHRLGNFLDAKEHLLLRLGATRPVPQQVHVLDELLTVSGLLFLHLRCSC